MDVSRVGGLLVGAILITNVGSATSQPLQEISIGLGSASLTGGTARIAKELGLFAKHGLEPRLLVMDSGSASATALVSRSLKVVVCGPGDLVTARARGQNVVAIAATYSGLGASLVISKAAIEKLGVSAKAPVSERLKALDGLVIGTTSPTTVATISLKRAAEAAGANIRFTYLTQPAFLAALESGVIQGHIGGAPFWARPIVRGSAVLWIDGPKGELLPEFTPSMSALLATMRDVADAEPELMKKLNAVFVDLGRAVEERPNDVKGAMARLFPDLDAATIDLLFESGIASLEISSDHGAADRARDRLREIDREGATADRRY